MVDLALGKTTIDYTGAAVEYTVTTNGTVTIKLWGGGGGGACNGSGVAVVSVGGGGGFVQFDLAVQTGDVVKIEAGQKGGPGNTFANAAGAGGWPDGGDGGYANAYYCCAGAGGGSTRVYLNNLLMAVSGGGGGGGGTGQLTNMQSPAGAGGGGGLTGQGVFKNNGVDYWSTGGDQSAGGQCLSHPAGGHNGSSLNGGDGFATGFTRVRNDSTSNVCGGGGGGGYFGGAGGADSFALFNLQIQIPGAGGSSYFRPSALIVNNTMTPGNRKVPGGSGDGDYVAGRAVGGNGGTDVGGTGGDGFAVLNFTDAPVQAPGDAEGLLGTIATTSVINGTASGGLNFDALTGPINVAISGLLGTGSVSAGGVGQAFPPVIVTQVIEGSALALVNATGLLPTLNILCLIVAGPIQEAFVTIDLAAALDPYPYIEMLMTASVTGEAEATILPFTPVALVPVQGYYRSEDQNTGGDLAAVTVTPIDGYAVQAQASPNLPVFMTSLALITASATGAANASGKLSNIPDNGMFGGISLTAPNGSPQTEDMTTEGAIPKVIVEPVQGIGLAGDDIVLTIGLPFTPIQTEWTNTPDQQASGGGNAYSQGNGQGNNPDLIYLVKTTISNINGVATGSVAKEVFFDLTITFATPVGDTQRGAFVNAPIGTVFVRRQLGGAGDNPNLEGDALAGGDLNPVILTPPEATYAVAGAAVGQGQLTVVLLPPEGGALLGSEFETPLPPPVILTAPEGLAFPIDPDSIANGDLTALITLIPPEAFMVAATVCDLPGPVVISGPTTFFRVVGTAGTAAFVQEVSGIAVFRRVENRVAVLEDVIERTVVMRE